MTGTILALTYRRPVALLYDWLPELPTAAARELVSAHRRVSRQVPLGGCREGFKL